MKEIQQKIKEFVEQHNLECPQEYHVLDAMSEFGEIAKELCKHSNYGRDPKTPADLTDEMKAEMKSELGDMMFCLAKLANAYEIDLEDALNMVLEKYKRRIEKGKSGPGSENE
ncbi:nucleotide pyrophosphohydrolase [Candidatus Woesearchaeota archaeon]|nr:nucleotide pyrophosphohydrolase [Candidatus Woesearchaeota archaeon]